MDGSNDQVNNSQQNNRTTSQGDQAPPSSGGTGGTQGGAAGPGGGAGGAAGASMGTAGGSNGSGGGPPIGGQESGRIAIQETLGIRISYDELDPEVLVMHHSGGGFGWSDMHHGVYVGPFDQKTQECTPGCLICKCNAIYQLIVSFLQG